MGSHWLYKLRKTDIISRHRQPKQNKVSSIFAIVLYIESHNTLSQQCFSFYLTLYFAYILCFLI